MADHITEHHDRFINRKALVRAYKSLRTLLAEYDVPATFAFVMGFVLSERERARLAEHFCDVNVDGRNWMRNFRAAEVRCNLDGWFCPEALEIIRERPEHEIGCHGFRHVPLADGAVSRDDAAFELAAASLAAQIKQILPKTFVFPRNQVGHLDLLRREGYVGYRAAPPQSRIGGRFANLAMEFHTRAKAHERLSAAHGLIPIPAGYFLNWRSGLRRIVPQWVTALRWQSIIDDAVQRDLVAHVWLHPHNVIDGPTTLDSLSMLLRQVAHARDTRGLRTLTQVAYCDEQLAGACG
jgi:peptidoglycan/xylan/chitin deacetylase (PgdA/CDA1 family)